MEMADMYNVSAMHEECVKSLSSNLDELGLDVNSVVFLFNFMSRPSVRVKFDSTNFLMSFRPPLIPSPLASQWGSEQFVFKPLVGPLRPCVMIAKDVQAQKYWIGDQDVGVFSVSESVRHPLATHADEHILTLVLGLPESSYCEGSDGECRSVLHSVQRD